jgi:hypothetical protein
MEREAATKVYRIPVRRIVANTNPGNPLSKELQKLGHSVAAQLGGAKVGD